MTIFFFSFIGALRSTHGTHKSIYKIGFLALGVCRTSDWSDFGARASPDTISINFHWIWLGLVAGNLPYAIGVHKMSPSFDGNIAIICKSAQIVHRQRQWRRRDSQLVLIFQRFQFHDIYSITFTLHDTTDFTHCLMHISKRTMQTITCCGSFTFIHRLCT